MAAATCSVIAASSSAVGFGSSGIGSPDTLIYRGNGANVFALGGQSASFPALKRSITTVQARLANDSDFTNLQGKLTTHANAASETITPDKTLILYDAAGTAYKVPCVAV